MQKNNRIFFQVTIGFIFSLGSILCGHANGLPDLKWYQIEPAALAGQTIGGPEEGVNNFCAAWEANPNTHTCGCGDPPQIRYCESAGVTQDSSQLKEYVRVAHYVGCSYTCGGGYSNPHAADIIAAGSWLSPDDELKKPCPITDQPVVIARGEKYYQFTDFSGAGNFPVSLTRRYNTNISYQLRDVVRAHWQFPYTQSVHYFPGVTENGKTGKAIVILEDERHVVFMNPGAAGDWIPSNSETQFSLQGVYESGTLVRWRLRYADGTINEFNKSTNIGRLKKIITPNGLSHTLDYTMTARGAVDYFTIKNDQTLEVFTVDWGNEKIISITAPGSKVFEYEWDNKGRLLAVIYPDDFTQVFEYNEIGFDALITGIFETNKTDYDTNNTSAWKRYSTVDYDSLGRVVTSELAGSAEKSTFVYNWTWDSSYASTSFIPTTTVTNARNLATTYTFSTDGLGVRNSSNWRVIAVEGADDPVGGTPGTGCEAVSKDTAYDAAGYLSNTTDGKGYVTSRTRDSQHRIETITTAMINNGGTLEPTVESQKTETDWHADLAVPVAKRHYGRASSAWQHYQTSTFTYDDGDGSSSTYNCDGNSGFNSYRVCSRTITDVLASPDVSHTWSYSYTLDSTTKSLLTMKIENTDISNDEVLYTYNSPTASADKGQLASIKRDYNGATYDQTTYYSAYNGFGLPETITDPNGVISTISYDARGRVIGIIADDGGIETETVLTYYPNGLLETVTQADGSSLEYFYNSAHQLISIENNFGEHIDFTPSPLDGQWTLSKTYKAAGTSSSDLITQYERVFDALGRLSKIKDASGAEKQIFGYDTNNNLTTRTLRGDTTNNIPYDENDLATVHQYDALDRLIRSVGNIDCGGACDLDDYNNYDDTIPSSPETEYEYNGQGLVSKVTDAEGHVTIFAYNGFGELTQENSPDRNVTTYQYDAAGNLSQKVKGYGTADEQVIAYSWDNLNRLTGVNYPGTDQDITYSYDVAASNEDCGESVGRLCRVTRGGSAGHITDYTYNALGRITAEKIRPAGTNGFALTTGYSYNTAGALTGITWPGGRTVAIDRSSGRIDEVNSSFGSTPIEHLLADNVGYQAFGGVLGYDMPTTNNENDVLRYQQNWDANGRLANWQFMKVGDDPLSMNYHYDAFGNISEIEDVASYGYDAQQRLVAAMGAHGFYSYQYDAVGNRTQMRKQAFSVNGNGDLAFENRWVEEYQYITGSNRLETVERYTGGTITGTPYRTREFTYDGRGNIKTDERTEGTTTTLELEYGNGDRLNSIDVQ